MIDRTSEHTDWQDPREAELDSIAALLLRDLDPEAAEYLLRRAQDGVYSIQFAAGGWYIERGHDAIWTEEMEAARVALAALSEYRRARHQRRSPIDPTAGGRGMSLARLITVRGD